MLDELFYLQSVFFLSMNLSMFWEIFKTIIGPGVVFSKTFEKYGSKAATLT